MIDKMTPLCSIASMHDDDQGWTLWTKVKITLSAVHYQITQTVVFAVTNKQSKVTFWPIISQFPLAQRFASFDRHRSEKKMAVDLTISLIDYCQKAILEF